MIGSLNHRKMRFRRLSAGILLGFTLVPLCAVAQERITFTPPPPLAEAATAFQPRPAADLLEAQIVLCRMNLSCGSIDGIFGPQTQAALRAFQRTRHLRVHGDFDEPTRRELILTRPAFTSISVAEADLAALRPVTPTWLEKSKANRLGYSSILEWAAERGHAHPNLVRRLNPQVDWDRIEPGTTLIIPDTERPETTERAASLLIHLEGKTLQAFDETGRLLMHFPCSIAQRVEKRPVGRIDVTVIAMDPNYTFDPAVFPESAEARELNRKLIIPPGPNNPVGLAWIGLSLPGYGIHGTPEPEKVGRTESHGCFRLANWNARTLSQTVWIGLPVHVEE